MWIVIKQLPFFKNLHKHTKYLQVVKRMNMLYRMIIIWLVSFMNYEL